MTLGRCLSHDNAYLTPSKGRSDSPLRLPCYLLSINFTRRRNKRERWRQTEEFTFKKMTSRRKSLQDVIDFIYRTFLKNKNKIMIQWKFRDFTTLFSCKKLTLHIIGIQCSKKEVKKQTVKWMRRKKRTACSTRLHFINPSKNLPRWNTRHINKPRKRSIP